MHDVHAVKPVEPWKKPAEQLVQVVAEAVPEYMPAKQFEQTVADDTEYLPAAHAPVTAVSPVVAQ